MQISKWKAALLIINGPIQLQGAKVKASDLRAGAALSDCWLDG